MPIFFIKDSLYFLTFLGNVLITGILLLLILHHLVLKPSLLRRLLDFKMDFLGRWGLVLAFSVALFAMLGSLFFSLVIGYPPCELCWYQRIFMYSLAFILGLAVFKNQERLIKPYGLMLASIGALIAAYQYILQVITIKNLDLNLLTPCSSDPSAISCSSAYDLAFGYITIPLMSLTGFLLIIMFLLYSRR